MSIRRLGTKPTYSEAIIHNNTVYLSGQVPWATAGLPILAQAKEVFELVEAQLRNAGSDKTRILSMQIFLTDPSDYEHMNTVFKSWIPNGFAPARNTICGITFPNSQWGIEVVVTAALN
jgi:enamine deaminase RidA (YjgF/YER057c/UK114 family)